MITDVTYIVNLALSPKIGGILRNPWWIGDYKMPKTVSIEFTYQIIQKKRVHSWEG